MKDLQFQTETLKAMHKGKLIYWGEDRYSKTYILNPENSMLMYFSECFLKLNEDYKRNDLIENIRRNEKEAKPAYTEFQMKKYVNPKGKESNLVIFKCEDTDFHIDEKLLNYFPHECKYKYNSHMLFIYGMIENFVGAIMETKL